MCLICVDMDWQEDLLSFRRSSALQTWRSVPVSSSGAQVPYSSEDAYAFESIERLPTEPIPTVEVEVEITNLIVKVGSDLQQVLEPSEVEIVTGKVEDLVEEVNLQRPASAEHKVELPIKHLRKVSKSQVRQQTFSRYKTKEIVI